ncbi:hypothetical protein Q6298_28145, partial [Klebsiella pneumoniae]|uniref:hypothetical protein n=1 Tax=Klebsiella pneumoniae TaxID=573 RepID=UPI002770EE4D|nr:hypothetical protein [Klebsiella pneumoniae]
TEIPEFNLPSTQTRAQVAAELRRAQANGEMQAFQEGYIQPAESTRTRAQVVAELRRAQANGEFGRFLGLGAEGHERGGGDEGGGKQLVH